MFCYFILKYAYIIYWIWLIILGVRFSINFYLYNMEDNPVMEDLGDIVKWDLIAYILPIFTFHWEIDYSDKLFKYKKVSNFLSKFFIYLSIVTFAIFILTYYCQG